jgi:sensor histidine kinase regulating citrate/malate metabolism
MFDDRDRCITTGWRRIMISRREQYRILVVFVILFLIMSVCLWYMAERTNEDIKESIRNELKSVATVIAQGIDGNTQAQFKPGDEQTPAFTSLRDTFNTIRQSDPSIRYIYTMRQNGSAVEFVVDADYGIESNAAIIGEVYPYFSPELLMGFTQPSAGTEFITDKWGTTLSGYAPIHDRNGNTVGIVGVDMESNRVIARQQSIVMNFLLVAILVLIIMAYGLVAVEMVRGKSVKKLDDQKEYLDALLNAVPAGIMVIDAGTKQIVDLNEHAAAMIGCPKEEIVGRVCHEFICPAETGKCPITDLGLTVDNAERVLITHEGTKIPIIKTVRKVTLLNKEYLVESFQEMPDKK